MSPSAESPPGVPAWLQPMAQLITTLGVPTVFAVVLLWFVLGKFEGNMDAITTRMADNTQTARALIDSFRTELVELQAQTAELRKQSDMLHDIADRSTRLLELRQQELREEHHAP